MSIQAEQFTLGQTSTIWEVKLTDCLTSQVIDTSNISTVSIEFTKSPISFLKAPLSFPTQPN